MKDNIFSVKFSNSTSKGKKMMAVFYRARENWDNPTTAGALSRWILWEDTSKTKAITDFKKKFNL